MQARPQLLLLGLCLIGFASAGCGALRREASIETASPAPRFAELSPGTRVYVMKPEKAGVLQIVGGTVLQAGPEGVALMNCSSSTQCMSRPRGLSRLPYLGRLFKNTGSAKELVPVMWIPGADIESLTVDHEPAAGEVPPIANIDLSHGFVSPQVGVDYDFAIADVESPQR